MENKSRLPAKETSLAKKTKKTNLEPWRKNQAKDSSDREYSQDTVDCDDGLDDAEDLDDAEITMTIGKRKRGWEAGANIGKYDITQRMQAKTARGSSYPLPYDTKPNLEFQTQPTSWVSRIKKFVEKVEDVAVFPSLGDEHRQWRKALMDGKSYEGKTALPDRIFADQCERDAKSACEKSKKQMERRKSPDDYRRIDDFPRDLDPGKPIDVQVQSDGKFTTSKWPVHKVQEAFKNEDTSKHLNLLNIDVPNHLRRYRPQEFTHRNTLGMSLQAKDSQGRGKQLTFLDQFFCLSPPGGKGASTCSGLSPAQGTQTVGVRID